MRQFFMVLLVAIATGLLPATVRAENPNQQAAQKISDHISASGQLAKGDRIAVRYLNGTVWLQGHVRDQEHLNKSVALVFATEGVTVNEVIRDELTLDGSESKSAAAKTIVASAGGNPLRGTTETTADDANNAQALPATFNPMHSATPVAMMQAAPIPPVPAPPVAAPAKLPATEGATGMPGAPLPMYAPATAAGGVAPVRYDRACMPGYAWPSYAAYPNYAAVTYPKQYSPTAWPYIGPFYPYPQVPLGWRKVSLQWDDGWWWLDFKDKPNCCWWR